MSPTPVRSRYADSRVVAVGLLAVLVLVLIGKLLFAADATPISADSPTVPTRTVAATTITQVTIGTASWAKDQLATLPTIQGPAPVPYDRDDYDNWLDVDDDCQSARHEVLIAESTTQVTFTGPDECKVESGHWVDPYSGQTMSLASEASIDHVVSLANAHHSGAWQWPQAVKQAFGSDIGDPAVLAVSATAVNSSKGSAPPDEWMPQTPEARCAYAIAWIRIKARWQLGVTNLERAALNEELDICTDAGLPTSPDSTPFALAEIEAIGGDSNDPEKAPLDLDTENCDPRYPAVCIPSSTRDLECADITHRRFPVQGADPHNFDGDDNGIGCEND